MTAISRRVKMPYARDQMYCLVNDIERYRCFVPGCVESTVEDVRDGHEVRATLRFQYRGISLGFTTLNRGNPPDSVKMNLVDGPFKYLEGEWRFVSLDDRRCEVGLQIVFDFSNRVYATMFGMAFQRLASSLLDAFVTRAHTLHGRG